MEILWRLTLGHLLADFTFQTNYINSWKRRSLSGLLVHCGMHPLFYLVLCWPYLGETWVQTSRFALGGWACLGIIFVAHFVEDWWRVFAINHHGMPDNTLFFLWDQVIHYAVIVAVAPMAAREAGVHGFFPEKWPVLACLFVLTTHANTVLVYFVEKDLHGTQYPGDDEKYLAMAERLVLALCFLFPSAAGAALLAAAWLGVMLWLRRRRLFDLTTFSFYAGSLTAGLCGLAARFVYYS